MRTPHLFSSRALGILVLSLVLTGALFSCTKPKQAAPLPVVSIGVAGFTQPQSTADLLAGFLPENTPLIDSKALPQLDEAFADVLRQKTKRSYVGVAAYQRCRDAKTPGQNQGRVAALRHWSAVGQCMDVDLLLVPHIVELRQREGGEAGVVQPAKVVMDVFLINTREGTLLGRSHFDETQTALTDNLLDTGKFFSRGGKWVTAVELAQEGMAKVVKELGL